MPVFDLAEDYADGLIPAQTLATVSEAADALQLSLYNPETAGNNSLSRMRRVAAMSAMTAAALVLPSEPVEDKTTDFSSAFWWAHEIVMFRVEEQFHPNRSKEEFRHQCLLVRDIFGNPFRPVPVAHSWLAWNNGAIVQLAKAIYDGRRFEDMPVLAKALESAGCKDAEILGHCRGPGPHARGCWLIDLLLGKN